MKEIQATTLDQLVLRRSKVNSALEKVGNLVASPNSIINKNLKQSTEESPNLHKHEIVRQIIADGLRRKEIHQRLQEKTEPYLKSLGLKIDDEILKRETKEDSDSILDEKGVFALASIWASNPSLAAEYGVEPLPQQVVLNLRPLIGDELLPTPEQQKEIAAPALGKILEVVNSDNLDQVYDCQPPPVQDLLLHLTTIDPESVVNFLNKALSECDETVQPTTLTEPTVDKMPESPKLKEIERRDPQIRETINELQDRLDAKGINKPINNPQLTKFFPSLKHNFVEQAIIERGYISPLRGRDHHPVFNREEITLLLYVREHGNNLTPRLIKELKEIIVEEIEQRSQNNGGQNGTSKDQSSPRVAIDQPQGPGVNGPEPFSSSEKPKPEDEAQIPAQDLSALKLFIKNPQIALSELTAILSQGEIMSMVQVRERLAEIAAKLHENINNGIASQREITIWEGIKTSTNMVEDKDALSELRGGIKTWYQNQKKLLEQTDQIIVAEDEIKDETEEVVGNVAKGEKVIDIPSIDTEPGLPINIIPEPTTNKRPAGRGIGRYLNRFRGTSSRHNRTREGIEAIISVSAHEIQEINLEDYRLQIEKALLERPDAKLTTMDKKHPNVRTMIYFYFDSFNKIKNWPINVQYLPQTGPGPSIEFISKLFDEGILTKNNKDDPLTFSKSDAAIVFFALHHGLKLTKTYIEDLRQIIKDEEYWDNLRNSD